MTQLDAMTGPQKTLLIQHLAGLLGDTLKKVGVLRQDVTVVGPELTLVAQEFLEWEGYEKEQIVAAALVMKKSGLVCSAPRPGRHDVVVQAAARAGLKLAGDHTQGFTTSEGRFVDRHEGLELARSTGQLSGELIGSILTSEDLW